MVKYLLAVDGTLLEQADTKFTQLVGSESSKNALEKLLILLRPSEDEVYLLTVVPHSWSSLFQQS